ncbi:hypothetical protein [Hymenobacter chitinivorans]|uniref:Biopolymer transport protein ExbD/TolR n=1 Tax=Hymenobacter chitinivorans DSM 11115 TaxID=1121954 RepID=A0A2M9BMQ0_9BACT|nr:hypothetical protein [Hymenobacter chitinivorans]PJJ59180.1 hypothetical protein CLV45_0595 [Hymenobacter chitinivorans DSM 11115]
MANSAAYHTRRTSFRVSLEMAALTGIALSLCLLLASSGPLRSATPPVQLPLTYGQPPTCILLDNPPIIISLDAQNRAYLETDSLTQTSLVQYVARQHGISFTAAELQQLGQLPFLSQSIEQLPAWLSASPTQRRDYAVGIPVAPGNDQLSEYIVASSNLYVTLYSPSYFSAGICPHFRIRADARLSFARVRQIMRVLQNQGINRFDFVVNYQ